LQITSTDLWDRIAEEAARESPLWGESLVAAPERAQEPVFSLLADDRYALGLETIYEGYLLHYGRPRLFGPRDRDTGLLLGDYLYAHGLVHVAAQESVDAVADLSALISLCAQLRAEDRDGDGAVWAATAALLGEGALDEARASARDRADVRPLLELAQEVAGAEAVGRALAAHARKVG